MKTYKGILLAWILLASSGLAPASGAPGPLDGAAPAAAWGEGGLPPEVARKARLAAEQGLAYDAEADAFVDLASLSPVPLLRPGMRIYADSIQASWCTAAFVYRSDDPARNLLFATAGHCTLWAQDHIYARVLESTIVHVGATLVTSRHAPPGDDWALVDVAPAFEDDLDPDVAVFMGPCGVVGPSDAPPTGLPVLHVGHGTIFGGRNGTGVPRAGVFHVLNATNFTYEGFTDGRDSGSPVLLVDPAVSGCAGVKALGIHTKKHDRDMPVPCPFPGPQCPIQWECPYVCHKEGTRATRPLSPGVHLVLGNGLPV